MRSNKAGRRVAAGLPGNTALFFICDNPHIQPKCELLDWF
jgi:hypothetical protein